MSDAIVITLIIMGGLVLIAVVWGLFSSGINEKSIVGQWHSGWLQRELAKLEVEKAKAMHEKVCPRTTDTPRKP